MTRSFPEIAQWIGAYLVGSDADSNNTGTQKMGQIEVQIGSSFLLQDEEAASSCSDGSKPRLNSGLGLTSFFVDIYCIYLF